MPMIRMTTGDSYEAVRSFEEGERVIVKVAGLFTMADRVSTTEWKLSSESARPGPEQDALKELLETGGADTTPSPAPSVTEADFVKVH